MISQMSATKILGNCCLFCSITSLLLQMEEVWGGEEKENCGGLCQHTLFQVKSCCYCWTCCSGWLVAWGKWRSILFSWWNTALYLPYEMLLSCLLKTWMGKTSLLDFFPLCFCQFCKFDSENVHKPCGMWKHQVSFWCTACQRDKYPGEVKPS